jgi:hypothetical protein
MANQRDRMSKKHPSSDQGLFLPPGFRFRQKWLCLWEDEDGAYIVNKDGEYLCAESFTPGDEAIEAKMRGAAKHYGIEGGNPAWIRGRKVSAMEADDQMERLLAGEIPDEQEEAIIALEEEWMGENEIS